MVAFQSGEDIYSNPKSETKDFVAVAVVFVFVIFVHNIVNNLNFRLVLILFTFRFFRDMWCLLYIACGGTQ